jgi:hypothetical protein
MPFFCTDADLLAWEPAIFLESAFAHQALLKDAPATLAGTTLTLSAAVLATAGILPGMVAQVTTGDGALTQLAEIAGVESPTVASVSALRGRSADPAIPPLTQGAVKVTVVSFRPQIAASGDALLALVGVQSSRDADATPASADLSGFGPACGFAALAALFRTLTESKHATNLVFSKHDFYDGLARAARQTLSATIDQDGDGIPETRVYSGSAAPVRT